jgi:acetyl-CoA carboxylase carboxyl transferase subunit alpha
MRITAQDLQAFGIVDTIIAEPSGGAHLDPATTAAAVGAAIRCHLDDLMQHDIDRLLADRYAKYREIGSFQEGQRDLLGSAADNLLASF